MQRKGIILAGGSGTRLYPVTIAVSKQLLPIYDKPMIYYPISVLMLAGIKEIAIITTPHDQEQFQRLLGDGSQFGVTFDYIVQASPDGLAQAYLLAEKFLDGAPSAMVLGDNIFFGNGLAQMLANASAKSDQGTVYGYWVANPERYGVVDFDEAGKAKSIIEKPEKPASNYALTGLYFLPGDAPERAAKVQASPRGELEITTLLEMYLHDGLLQVDLMGRGYAWLDTGTHSSLLEASEFVRTLEDRQAVQIGCLEEIGYNNGWISSEALLEAAEKMGKSNYGNYINQIAQSARTRR